MTVTVPRSAEITTTPGGGGHASDTATPFRLSQGELAALQRIADLKAASGSHSPSIASLSDRLPGLEIRVDACFLSNPYATDLFVERLTADLIATGAMRKVLESYPSQNAQLAGILEPALGVDQDKVFVCNGAVEVIQAAMHRFAGRRVAVVLPTFSPYYEYLRPDQEAVPYRLSRENGFTLDVDDFARFVERERIDTVCLINPSNPSGSYVPRSEMLRLLGALAHLRLVIVDESFVDFAWEDAQRTPMSLAPEVAAMPNAILVKSMSKDFGVAGLRVGYAIMAPDRVRKLLGNGYLWNVSGLAEFFFRLFAERRFREDYERARVRYIDDALRFFGALGQMPMLRAYPTKANFALVELDPSVPVSLIASLMLIRHGIYVRDCCDKVGLEDGQYLRIAGRKAPENELVLAALRSILADN